MDKHYIRHTDKISIEEINQMIEDIEDILYHIERFNETLAEKILNRHPLFCGFVRALILSNCNAVKATIQVKGFLDKTVESYLNESDDNSSAHS